jgi:hypothetical protein
MPDRIVEVRFVDRPILWMLGIQTMRHRVKDAVTGQDDERAISVLRHEECIC